MVCLLFCIENNKNEFNLTSDTGTVSLVRLTVMK